MTSRMNGQRCRTAVALALGLFAGGLTAGVDAAPAVAATATIKLFEHQDALFSHTVPISGSVSVTGSRLTHVAFAVDVSGSTDTAASDCNGDGKTDDRDDPNQDGKPNTVLDCEIAAVVAANVRLAGAQGIGVAMVPFAGSAVVADMSKADGLQRYMPAGSGTFGETRIRTFNVSNVASSLTTRHVSRFADHSLSDGTNFDAVLDAIAGLEPAPDVAVLVTDGADQSSQESFATALRKVVTAGIAVAPFVIGGSCIGHAAEIGNATGRACVEVDDPSKLVDFIAGAPPGVAGVTVRCRTLTDLQ